MKIGGLIENRDLTLYRITTLQDVPGSAGIILKFYARRDINLEFITKSSALDGNSVMVICIKNSFVPQVDAFMDDNREAVSPYHIHKTENVATLGIYGPHFREKPAIAARFCSLLGSAGINILGISSSISSVCCVIDQQNLEKGKTAILQRFELP